MPDSRFLRQTFEVAYTGLILASASLCVAKDVKYCYRCLVLQSLCVCCLLDTFGEFCETAELIGVPRLVFGLAYGEPEEPRIRWGADFPGEGAFWERGGDDAAWCIAVCYLVMTNVAVRRIIVLVKTQIYCKLTCHLLSKTGQKSLNDFYHCQS